MSPIVTIVGPPGAGKTTVARLVAAELGVPLRDSDEDIEANTGMTIADIFVGDGEERFRQLETEAINAALDEHDGVLSLGGGAVLSAITRERLEGRNVVFLDVGLSAAVRRVGMNANRPLLLGNVRSTLKQLMDQRRPLYQQVARHTIVTDDMTAAQVADRLLEQLGEQP